MKDFYDMFNYRYKNNERIPKEEFLNYDIYRRNLEKILGTSNQSPFNNEGKILIILIQAYSRMTYI